MPSFAQPGLSVCSINYQIFSGAGALRLLMVNELLFSADMGRAIRSLRRFWAQISPSPSAAARRSLKVLTTLTRANRLSLPSIRVQGAVDVLVN